MRKSDELDEFPDWRRLQAQAIPLMDAQGRPFVQVKLDGKEVPVGICRGNALHVSGSPELLQNWLLSRLDEQLRTKKPRISEPSIKSDWKLLESAREESRAALAPAN
jgi:hypothetical protein